MVFHILPLNPHSLQISTFRARALHTGRFRYEESDRSTPNPPKTLKKFKKQLKTTVFLPSIPANNQRVGETQRFFTHYTHDRYHLLLQNPEDITTPTPTSPLPSPHHDIYVTT